MYNLYKRADANTTGVKYGVLVFFYFYVSINGLSVLVVYMI